MPCCIIGLGGVNFLQQLLPQMALPALFLSTWVLTIELVGPVVEEPLHRVGRRLH